MYGAPRRHSDAYRAASTDLVFGVPGNQGGVVHPMYVQPLHPMFGSGPVPQNVMMMGGARNHCMPTAVSGHYSPYPAVPGLESVPTMGMTSPNRRMNVDNYEVHDKQLKALIAVTPEVVVPTMGSDRLFASPPRPIVYGSRNAPRVCDVFQEGYCVAGSSCHDLHMHPQYLQVTRQRLSSWVSSKEEEFHHTLRNQPSTSFRVFVADLKEVVEIGISSLEFTKGLYVDPTTRAKRTRAGGLHQQGHNATLAAQVPTSCGLYSADPTQCKWGRWCNQVHIDAAWMRAKKEMFEAWFSSLEDRYLSLPSGYLFTVHDPYLRTSLLLPKFSIASFSRGLFQGSNKKAPSVCLLFQRSRCTAGACCNQIHVIQEYLCKHRELIESEKNHTPSSERHKANVNEMEMLKSALMRQQSEMDEQERKRRFKASEPLKMQQSVNLIELPDESMLTGGLIEHIPVDDDICDQQHNHSRTDHSGNRSSTTNGDTAAYRAHNGTGTYINSYYRRSFSMVGAPLYSSCSCNPASESIQGSHNMENRGYMDIFSQRELSVSLTRSPPTGSPMGHARSIRVVAHLPGNKTAGSSVIDSTISGSAPERPNVTDTAITGRPGDTGTPQYTGGSRAGLKDTGAQRAFPTLPRLDLHWRGSFGDSWNGIGGAMVPADFDVSLHFSPSPLLNFNHSTSSVSRGGAMSDEEAARYWNRQHAILAHSTGYGSSTSHRARTQSRNDMAPALPAESTSKSNVTMSPGNGNSGAVHSGYRHISTSEDQNTPLASTMQLPNFHYSQDDMMTSTANNTFVPSRSHGNLATSLTQPPIPEAGSK